MKPEQAKALRAPFRPEQIGKLPKAGITLDYVGHAATTDRLLQVDPEWTWEPMAYGPNGEPLMTNGGLWIKLTVCGVTRPGFGDGKNPKEIIGDAIRNAAMRFGVALDLWAKEDLSASSNGAGSGSVGEPKADERVHTVPVSQAAKPQQSKPASPAVDDPAGGTPFAYSPLGEADVAGGMAGDDPPGTVSSPALVFATKDQKKSLDRLVGTLRGAGHITTEQVYKGCNVKPIKSDYDPETDRLRWSTLRDRMSKQMASGLIDRLLKLEASIDDGSYFERRAAEVRDKAAS